MSNLDELKKSLNSDVWFSVIVLLMIGVSIGYLINVGITWMIFTAFSISFVEYNVWLFGALLMLLQMSIGGRK